VKDVLLNGRRHLHVDVSVISVIAEITTA